MLLLLAALTAGLLVPVPDHVRPAVNDAASVGVAVLFLSYGLRLPTSEVLAGVRNVVLQGAILASTFVVFPLLGLLLSLVAAPVIGPELAAGVLFLSVLPSTVQGSVALTSIAKGNVPAAITAATLSNVLGMILTPVLVLWLMDASANAGLGGLRSVLGQLLLPFIVGQLLSRWAGAWIRRRKALTVALDRGVIMFMLFNAVSAATAQGVWAQVHWSMLVVVAAISLAVLTGTTASLWFLSPHLRLGAEERTVLTLCGSQKSLATGLPIGAVLFAPTTLATLVVPLIIYHQLQLIAGAVLARRIAKGSASDAP